ncbi:MAG: hypothetical protein ACI35O_04030 [Bacillaceae bacterium]
MKQFIDDMIHMTEGEKFVHYWWIWVSLVVIGLIVFYVTRDKD